MPPGSQEGPLGAPWAPRRPSKPSPARFGGEKEQQIDDVASEQEISQEHHSAVDAFTASANAYVKERRGIQKTLYNDGGGEFCLGRSRPHRNGRVAKTKANRGTSLNKYDVERI